MIGPRSLLRPAPTPDADPGQGARRLRFLGTAGFVIEARGHTLVLDPYLSRPGLLRSLFGRLEPDAALLAREIPAADHVLCGHAHHDHALDAPVVCRNTGAILVGSRATLNLGRAAGLPEAQLLLADRPLTLGPHRAVGHVSRHGKALLVRVPLPGDIPVPPPWPPRLWDLRHGTVYTWELDLGDTRVLHVDSADFDDEALAAARCDVLCLCAVGRQYRPDYTRRIVELTRPQVVIPCHWDDFTTPWGVTPRQLPGVDVAGFVDEIRAAGARALVLGLGQRWAW